MSHIVSIATKVRDPIAVTAACRRLGLSAPTEGTAQLYSGRVSGLLLNLPGWQYPTIIDLTTGDVRYDNYGGAWGRQEELNRFLQTYAAEKAKIEARRQGHFVTEQTLADGSLKLTIQMGGAT